MAIIIGGGPCGLMTASELSKKGITAKVIEEDPHIGKPVQCTGILTTSIKKIMKVENSAILNRLKRAEIICGNNHLELPVDDIVVDRVKFDKQIKDMALSDGAEIETSTKALSISRKNNNIVVKTDKKSYLCRNLIGADGPFSITKKFINKDIKTDFIISRQAIVKGKFDEDCFKVYLGSDAPGFFAWVVPESSKIARVGIGSKKNPNIHFERLLKKLDIKKSCILEEQGGLIPIYDPSLRTEADNIYIVGDAAGHVKATTGGGIIPGLQSAKILAKTISEAKSYEKGWRKELGRELWMHLKIRKGLDKFSDNDYRELIRMLSDKSSKKIFAEHNRDNIYSMFLELAIKKPGLAKFLPKFI